MPQKPLDSGAVAALLCAFYPGITPWNLDDLEDGQRDLYLKHLGLIRFYRDLPALQASFAKVDDEGVEKILNPPSEPDFKAKRRALAWEQYALKPYGLLVEATEPEGPQINLSAEAAEGLVRWWESGDLYKLPDGAQIWARHLAGIHRQLIGKAEQMKK